MKILALMPDGYKGFGGIAQYNRDVIDALNDHADVESIFSLTRHSSDTSGLPAKLTETACDSSPAVYGGKAFREARRFGPDLILCGHINLMPVAAIIGRRVHRPVMLETYGIDSWQCPNRFASRAAGSADLILAISRYTRSRFLNWAPVEPNRVKVVCNAIRLNEYRSGDAPAYLMERYGVQRKRVLLTVGRLSASERYKGQDRIIQALPRLIADFPDLVFLIAGDGDDLPRLKEMASSLGVADHVVFAGRLSESEKTDHYNLADAFAMPSTGEGFGFVFLEAAACGLPVLGGNGDGSRDALADGEIGLMVDPDSPDELLSGLKSLLTRPKCVPAALQAFAYPRFRSQIQRLVYGLAA